MQNPNENVTSTFDTPPGTDRLPFIWHRARKLVLMLGPWIMIVAGLIDDPLHTVGDVLFALGLLALLTFWYRVRYTTFTDKPHLKIALTSFTPKQFRHWGEGLDEREKLVVAQAFHMSYRILAMVCILAFGFIYFNIQVFHLPYHLGLKGSIYLILGSMYLLIYLPTSIFAWHEGI